MIRCRNGRFPLMYFFFCIALSTMVFADDIHDWDEQEIAVLRCLSLASLPPLLRDPSNKYEEDPRAIALGRKFFFDHRFSGNVKVACATCHPENMNFADNLPLAHGMGTTTRRSMPLIGMAYQSWYFWDGRKDSLWSQALGPFESPVEHGFTRTLCAKVIIEHYKKEYEEIFGVLPLFNKRDLPAVAKPSSDEPDALKAWVRMPIDKKMAVNRIYANMGKAIAAFVRTIIPGESRFDMYVNALVKKDKAAMKAAMTNEEVKGLRLFIGKGKCTNCHNGPLFTNGEFHNIRVPRPVRLQPDNGRADAIIKVLADEFNCLSVYSDARRRECKELRFIDIDRDKYMAAFKTPTLRNVAERAPYMHAGQFATLSDVLTFYRDLNPEERPEDLEHGDLSDDQLLQHEAFLKALSSPLRCAGH